MIDDLWGDEGVGTAKNTLQSKVSQLRKALGDPELVKGGAAGYSLALDPSAVDAIEVCRLAELASTLLAAGDSGEAFRASSAALEMFRGESLADTGEAEWLRPHRARLVEVHEQLIEDAIAARLEMGAAAELIGELEALVQLHPLRERLRGQLMLALYRAGRQADTLRAYQTARAVLGEELGLEPGRELQRLEAAILAQDPDLDPPERPGEGDGCEPTARAGNLPAAVSSFVGRSRELDEVSDLVGTRRLVTLVGPGGAGKTRLALEVGERVRRRFRRRRVAHRIRAAEIWQRRRRCCRHGTRSRRQRPFGTVCRPATDAVAVRQLRARDRRRRDRGGQRARAGPGVTVLATSRERLGASGEMLYSAPLPRSRRSR